MLIHALPIFHVHGLFVAIHGALLNGSKMIWFGKFDPKRRDPQDAARRRSSWACPRCTCACWPSRRLNREAARNMRLFISGSAPLADRDLQRMAGAHRPHHPGALRHERNHHAHLQSLPTRGWRAPRRHRGLSAAGRGRARARRRRARGARRARSAASRSRDPTCSRATGACPRRRSEEFTDDGWFKTGDVGKIDERGYVTIVGRSKDLIISGGYNVYPAEIEGYINDMPGVAESALVGVPHPDFGEVGVAVVIPKPGAQLDGEQIVAQLKSQLANFKIPKRCFVVERAAAQQHGQGPEEPAARAAQAAVRLRQSRAHSTRTRGVVLQLGSARSDNFW